MPLCREDGGNSASCKVVGCRGGGRVKRLFLAGFRGVNARVAR